MFEYGGIRPPMDITNQNGELVQIYELGMLIKEVREDKWKPKMYFFTAGNLWSHVFISEQYIFKWALCVVVVDMDELFR